MGRKTDLYIPLKKYLKESGQKKVTLTFDKINDLLKESRHKLPDSAYDHREWWGNCIKNPQAKQGWMKDKDKDEGYEGYEVAAIYKKKIKDENNEEKEVYCVDFVKILKDNDDTLTAQGEDEVKKCISCSRPINKGFVFCPYCGEKQIKKCPKCGTILKENFNYCPNCGNKLDETKNA